MGLFSVCVSLQNHSYSLVTEEKKRNVLGPEYIQNHVQLRHKVILLRAELGSTLSLTHHEVGQAQGGSGQVSWDGW